MTYDIIYYFMLQNVVFYVWALVSSHQFLIYDFKCLSDLGPGLLKKGSKRVFWDALGMCGAFCFIFVF